VRELPAHGLSLRSEGCWDGWTSLEPLAEPLRWRMSWEGGEGRCFQKHNALLAVRSVFSLLPSESSKANEREDRLGLEEVGVWTHEGSWVIEREGYMGFSVRRAFWHSSGV
jgi:hypothetical protein